MELNEALGMTRAGEYLKNPRLLLKLTGEELEGVLNYSREVRLRKFGNKIFFYVPTFITSKTRFTSFPPETYLSFSITGNRCALRCLHCNGRLLGGMIPVKTPEELVDHCRKFKDKGALGCLVSGGCTLKGDVPLKNFIDAISYIKCELGFNVAVHTGLIQSEDLAWKLRDADIDSVLLDVIGSDETLKEIYRVNMNVKNVEMSLEILSKARLPIVPHVLVGLHYGQILGEFEAINLISKFSPKALVIIVLIPLRETPMENILPPKPTDVVKVVVYAELLLQTVPLALGCARPTGSHRVETDLLAIKAGINAITLPSNEAVHLAENLGLEISFMPSCCSKIYQDLSSIR